MLNSAFCSTVIKQALFRQFFISNLKVSRSMYFFWFIKNLFCDIFPKFMKSRYQLCTSSMCIFCCCSGRCLCHCAPVLSSLLVERSLVECSNFEDKMVVIASATVVARDVLDRILLSRLKHFLAMSRAPMHSIERSVLNFAKFVQNVQ